MQSATGKHFYIHSMLSTAEEAAIDVGVTFNFRKVVPQPNQSAGNEVL